jgi:release factor glutamine methyltransferase
MQDIGCFNYSQAFTFLSHELKRSGITSSHLDARILLSHVVSKPLEVILSNPEKQLTTEEINSLNAILARRLKFEPIAYITKKKEFYGRPFIVDSNVLIPRSETELLVEIALKTAEKFDRPSLLELGTGSGCIITTLALERRFLGMDATDISDEALNIARQNAGNLGVLSQINFINSNWLENLEPNKRYDIIVSNPPYIATTEIGLIAKETLLYEPYLALFANQNGLSSYMAIASKAKQFLNPNGKIIVEIGYAQQSAVSELFNSFGYILESACKDLSGHDRVLVFSFS